MDRRNFLVSAAAGGLLLPAGLVLADDRKSGARTSRPPKVGGAAAGALPAQPKARVSSSAAMSSLVLSGQRTQASLGFGYGTVSTPCRPHRPDAHAPCLAGLAGRAFHGLHGR